MGVAPFNGGASPTAPACGTLAGPLAAGATAKVVCGTAGLLGRYVSLQLKSPAATQLGVCEVTVFAHPAVRPIVGTTIDSLR